MTSPAQVLSLLKVKSITRGAFVFIVISSSGASPNENWDELSPLKFLLTAVTFAFFDNPLEKKKLPRSAVIV